MFQYSTLHNFSHINQVETADIFPRVDSRFHVEFELVRDAHVSEKDAIRKKVVAEPIAQGEIFISVSLKTVM